MIDKKPNNDENILKTKDQSKGSIEMKTIEKTINHTAWKGRTLNSTAGTKNEWKWDPIF